MFLGIGSRLAQAKVAGIIIGGPAGKVLQMNKVRETSARLGMKLPSMQSLEGLDLHDLSKMNKNLLADLEGHRMVNQAGSFSKKPDEPIYNLTKNMMKNRPLPKLLPDTP